MEKQSLKQSKYIHTSGAIDEMNFSLGGNYGDNYTLEELLVFFHQLYCKNPHTRSRMNRFHRRIEDYAMEDYLYIEEPESFLNIGLLYQPLTSCALDLPFIHLHFSIV
jgi:hypothetical protein